MPMCYDLSLATAGNLTTNATPATETDAFFVKAGSGRTAMLEWVAVGGKGAALASISGIAFRLVYFATASTAGTGITPKPVDPGMQAAKHTSASRPSAGSTRTQGPVFTCGGGGPGGWFPRDQDRFLVLEAGAAGSVDMMDVSGTASMVYEWSAGTIE